MRFLNHSDVVDADEIYLLGDIFDLMIGNKPEYIKKHQEIFDLLKEHAISGKTIHYFEGNHDFHVRNLFRDWASSFNGSGSVKFHKKGIVREISGKKIYFSHGDDIEIHNPAYKIYKALINNFPLELVADHVFPFRWIEFIGHRASAKSRERNKSRYEKVEHSSRVLRDKFRESARRISKKTNADVVICGHSHVKDNFHEEGLIYANSGYAPIEKTFLLIKPGGGPEFVEIT